MLLVSKRDPTGWWKGKNIMSPSLDDSAEGSYFPGNNAPDFIFFQIIFSHENMTPFFVLFKLI